MLALLRRYSTQSEGGKKGRCASLPADALAPRTWVFEAHLDGHRYPERGRIRIVILMRILMVSPSGTRWAVWHP
jgi:hypothetical protein